MRLGQRVGARFEIEREAGVGGMGTVYRALDVEAGEFVALKLLQRGSGDERSRFAREARALAQIDHPGVVRYVAHGATDDGVPYLAMEWLDGEDLAARLARARLTIGESAALARRIAEIIGYLHVLGVVHRDIKPANIFLQGGDLSRVKLLDFGIVRLDLATTGATRTGVGLGTPGYMAPEQARGARDVDARADLFSLGCVLFECLTQRPAWIGEHVMAVLAKVLFDEAPRVREYAPSAPAALDALVDQMLRKEPSERPESAALVASALASIEASADLPTQDGEPRALIEASTTSPAALTQKLTAAERRMVFVLLIGARRDEARRAREALDTVLAGDPAATPPASRDAGAAAAATILDEEGALRAAIVQYGGACHKLADGTWAATLAGSGAVTDQAARAAKCALSVRSILLDRPAALATGHARTGGRGGLGEVIDRAARLLQSSVSAGSAPREDRAAPIWIDEPTAALLDARFRFESSAAGLMLLGESEASDDARTLLGKKTPCVGRDRELRALEDGFDACATEPAAQVILVTGAAGVGKSRLRHELTSRIRSRDPSIEVWIARGDPVRAGPLGLLGQIIRRAARLSDGEPMEELRVKLQARVLRRVDPSIAVRVTEFLGEIVGAKLPDEHSVKLRAARQEPTLMSDQMRAAWLDFVEAECDAGPVLLILEDLHWGDSPSLEYVDSALRLFRDLPLMVIGLARPEVDDLFPKLWSERGVTKMHLGELSRKACEKLTLAVLGDAATPETRVLLWERSSGNAFFLEELMRAVAEGRGEELPSTVAAMMHSRLLALDPLSRRALRAGSIFGQVFWRGALTALLGVDARSLAGTLADLETRELITQQREASFQGEAEYSFRHSLVRDAAYAMLTEEDCSLGHRLAAGWLESAGEHNAGAIAEHFDRGGDLPRAAEWYQRAAEQALAGNDLPAVLARVDRALTCGASGEALGELSLLRAQAHTWKGDFAEAERWALDALNTLPKGGERWFDALEDAAQASARLGHKERFDTLANELMASWSEERPSRAQVIASVHVAAGLRTFGEYARSDALFAKIESVNAFFRSDPLAMGHLTYGRGFIAFWNGDLSDSHEWLDRAARSFDEAGDVRQALFNRVNAGHLNGDIGADSERTRLFRDMLPAATRMGLDYLVACMKNILGISLERLGAVIEAASLEREAIAASLISGDRRLEGDSRKCLASLLLRSGDLTQAYAEARRAVELLAIAPPLRPQALATLARIELAQGRTADALTTASNATAELLVMGHVEEGEATIRLTYAEALFANGDRDRASIAIAEARTNLLERAAKISDPTWRKSFLENVPENARTLELASQWLQ